MMLSTVCGGERLAGQGQHGVPDLVDLAVAELGEDVADRAGEREDQRRQREHREERRLGSETGDPVAHAGADRRHDEPPQRAPDGLHESVRAPDRGLLSAAMTTTVRP